MGAYLEISGDGQGILGLSEMLEGEEGQRRKNGNVDSEAKISNLVAQTTKTSKLLHLPRLKIFPFEVSFRDRGESRGDLTRPSNG
jgi:hypothetical protein